MHSSLAAADSAAPQRIAFCITDLDPGGAERCLVELATRLARRKFEPVVYCLAPRPPGNPISLADRLEENGVPVHCFGARHLIEFPLLATRLRRRMIADSPRLVQTFLFHANVAGAIAAHRARVEHVVTGIRVAERRAGWHLTAARLVDRWVERHVCVSRAVREDSIRRGRLPAEKLVVIPNGVDFERFASARPCDLSQLGMDAARRLITFVGRLDKQKGLDLLLQACGPMLGALPDHDLLVVGDGPERAALKQQLRESPHQRRVHFVGHRADVPEILAATDLVVVPSRWEGMSNVVLEAMASGRPIVATDVEGISEELGPQAARQTAPATAEGLADRVVAVLRDPPLAHSLGAANQQRAQQCFGLARMVEAYERLYWALLPGG